MEDVLVLCKRPYDEPYPTVCLDEKPVVLHAEVQERLPLAPGHVERRDKEYERHGTSNLFALVEPLAGWRHVAAAEHRTKQDSAECLRDLVEEHYPEAERISLVQNYLNTHTAGAPVRDVASGAGPLDLGPAGVLSHPQARQLTEPSRDREQRLRARLPRLPRAGHGDLTEPGAGPGGRTQPASGHHGVAGYATPGLHQAQATLPRGQNPTRLSSSPSCPSSTATIPAPE
jgi:hypothetical protein